MLHQLLNKHQPKEDIIAFMETNEDLFPDLVTTAVSTVKQDNWRAAWVLQSMLKKNDPRLSKHIDGIIAFLPSTEDGHQRELLKVLYKQELSEEQESKLFDTCITLWETLKKSPSARITAFKQIEKTIKKYPELVSEISFLLEDHYLETLSPGVKLMCLKMRKEMQQML
ncbi:MAG: hypothetical protein ACI8P7_001442 [Candidatus Azotimanducaceae bacterium]|jgi:hypothetical protein